MPQLRAPLRVLQPPHLVPYPEGLRLQHELLGCRRRDDIPDTLLLLQHPPVITLGRNADPAGVLAPPALLSAQGVTVERVERGGQATYHGPGQWVGYPILSLRERNLGVRRYVDRLEEMLIRTCARFGVRARRRPRYPGLFTDQGKIAALGVAVRGGVTFHGFALNVCPDLSHFRWIVPCGLSDTPATSLAETCPEGAPPLADVAEVLVEEFTSVFGYARCEDTSAGPSLS